VEGRVAEVRRSIGEHGKGEFVSLSTVLKWYVWDGS
jgi:hypothetical protein